MAEYVAVIEEEADSWGAYVPGPAGVSRCRQHLSGGTGAHRRGYPAAHFVPA